MIKKLFSAQVFESEEDTIRAKFIRGFIWIVILLLSIALLFNLGSNADENAGITIIVLSVLILLMFLALFALRQGFLNLSGLIIIIPGWLGLGIQAYAADGVRDVIIIAFIALSLLASIIINWRAGGILMVLSIAAIWALAYLEVNGYITPRFQEPLEFSRDLSMVYIATAVLIYFSTTSLREAIHRASTSEAELRTSNQVLQELNQTLEERISERTTGLETANRFNSNRARQFEAIAQVVGVISSIQDLNSLLPRIAEVVSEQFETYHTGIFLLDGAREFAVLRASNSEGGKKMLAREHKLRVGQTGIVGFVTGSGQPRIALNVGEDAVFFDNPDLPNTYSEIALPLIYAGLIIGALDVQSTESNAFSHNDIEVLTILANQIAVAIHNTLILEEARRSQVESQKKFGEDAIESWKVMQPKSMGVGFQLVGSSLHELDKPIEGDHIQEAISQEKTTFSNSGNQTSNFAIPIRLRKQVVGVLNLRSRNNHVLTQDDVDIAEAVSERLSLAIETATLLQNTQHRADMERITTDISSKISSYIRFETILQTVAKELSLALGGSDVIVQIEPASMALDIDNQV